MAAANVISQSVIRLLLASQTVRLCAGVYELGIRNGKSAMPAVAIVQATINPLEIKALPGWPLRNRISEIKAEKKASSGTP